MSAIDAPRRPTAGVETTRAGTGRRRAWSLLVTALMTVGLALVPGAAGSAAAQTAEPVTAETSWPMDCVGVAAGIRQPETNAARYSATAPATVEPGAELTARIAPQRSSFPDQKDSIIGPVSVSYLQNIKLTYELPANAELVSASVVEGSAVGIEGTPTVALDSSTSPARIALQVPKVPKNPTPPTNETFFTLPAVDLVLRATGTAGSTVSTRVAGTNEATSGYVFQAVTPLATADVRCWPQGEVAAPTLFRTAISSGSTTTPTTTTLTATPTRLPAGNEVTLRAAVTGATTGAVRFSDGGTVLGLAELNPEGVASLTATLDTVGERSLTAQYLGSPGFDASTSAPVTVTVTDPANRTPVRITVAADPAAVSLGTTNLAGSTTATVTVAPTGGTAGVPTGNVTLYDNTTRVGTQALSGTGHASFPVSLAQGGHRLRAEYTGDSDFFAATGSTPVDATHTDAATSNTVHRAVSGSIRLNDATGDVPSGSVLASSFRTNGEGDQTLDGTLLFPTQTLAVPGGTVTGRLALAGLADGAIQPGADGAATLDAELFFQAQSADLGDGAQDLASGCAVGPFPVALTGTRAGTDGELTLQASRFRVPFVADGSCVGPAGDSLAAAVGDAFAGADTALSLTLTPPSSATALEVAPLTVTPDEPTPYGQPVTLSATVTLADGGNLPEAGSFTVEFYDGDLVVGTSFMNVTAGQAGRATLALPSGIIAALAQGNHDQLRARAVPSNAQKLVYATSLRSEPVSHEVTAPIEKTTPALVLDAPETLGAGRPAPLTVRLTPAPSEVEGLGSAVGEILVYDDAAPGGPRNINLSPSYRISVSATSNGVFEVQTSLAPGRHELRAVFTLGVGSAWLWTESESGTAVHTVTGDPVPTALEIVNDSTGGTGLVPAGSDVIVRVQLRPLTALSPLRNSRIWYDLPDGTTASGFLFSSGSPATITINRPELLTPGRHTIRFYFEPSFRGRGLAGAGQPNLGGNEGYASSETTYTYEVVTPGSPSPMPTGVQMTGLHPNPAPVGTTWTFVSAEVTRGAVGSMSFNARSTASGEVTALGTAALNSASQAQLNTPAPTSSLPAGTYEVSAAFTPSDPTRFAASTSAPRIVRVLEPGDLESTTTRLTVSPTGRSTEGQAAVLSATVTPTEYASSSGTVHFYDGDTLLGAAVPVLGRADFATWGLPVGEHQLKAVFVPNPGPVAGGSSATVAHTVVAPPVATTTSLAVSPEGSSDAGDEVTLTATVDPDDAAGEVVFTSSDGGELGRARLTDGEAELEVDDLAAGEQQLTASFVPDDPEAFAPSTSEPVAHTVVVPVTETTTALTVTPASPTPEGTALILTATVDPAEAAGTVELLDGSTALGTVAIADGTASLTLDDPAAGAHSFTARFVPEDPALFTASQSAAVDHTVEPDGAPEPPVMECRGADAATRALLEALLPTSGGVLRVDTPVTADVPDQVELGTPTPVGFEWGFVVPDDLANLAEQANADLSLSDVDGGIVASGGATARWAFPQSAEIADLDEPVALTADGDVTATSRDPITYRVTPELSMTIAVAVPGAPIRVPLACTVSDEVVATTDEVTLPAEGGIVVTDADGNVVDDGATLRRGQRLTVVAWPYDAEEDVAVTLSSEPRDRGTVPADVDGVVTYLFTVPDDLETGDHELVLAGAELERRFRFIVTDEPGGPGGGGGNGGGGSGGNDGGGRGRLPFTGGAVLPLVAVGLALVAAGAVTMTVRRRLRLRPASEVGES